MKYYCLDSNIFITAWDDHYPIQIQEFGKLWDRLAILKNANRIILIDPMLKEIKANKLKKETLPLRKWLEDNRFEGMSIDLEDKNFAFSLRREYQVKIPSKKHPKGVNFNDTILVAYAHNRRENHVVVTYEAKQPNYIEHQGTKKIPLVCKEKGVECITFVEMLKELEK